LETSGIQLKRIDDAWWLDDDGELYGPYDTKKEAEEDKRGLTRFYKYEGKKGYVTTCY
jgi:hypothetical protein